MGLVLGRGRGLQPHRNPADAIGTAALARLELLAVECVGCVPHHGQVQPWSATGALDQYPHQRALVLYWYQSRDRVIASEYIGKVLLVRDALFSGRTSGSIVRIVVPDRPGCWSRRSASPPR